MTQHVYNVACFRSRLMACLYFACRFEQFKGLFAVSVSVLMLILAHALSVAVLKLTKHGIKGPLLSMCQTCGTAFKTTQGFSCCAMCINKVLRLWKAVNICVLISSSGICAQMEEKKSTMITFWMYCTMRNSSQPSFLILFLSSRSLAWLIKLTWDC